MLNPYFYRSCATVLTRIMITCPNIEELHLIGFLIEQQTALFFSEIQLQELTMLSFYYIESIGNFMPCLATTFLQVINGFFLVDLNLNAFIYEKGLNRVKSFNWSIRRTNPKRISLVAYATLGNKIIDYSLLTKYNYLFMYDIDWNLCISGMITRLMRRRFRACRETKSKPLRVLKAFF